MKPSLWILPLLIIFAAPLQATPLKSDLDDLRQVYLAAVQDEASIDPGLDLLERMRHQRGEDGVEPATLEAYQGAFIALRAKHGTWPPARLRHLQDGLARLDAAVAMEPRNAEARYLRLITCFYLPRLFARQPTVDNDFAALAILLPDAAHNFPPALFATMTRFVLEEGEPTPAQERSLRAAIETRSG